MTKHTKKIFVVDDNIAMQKIAGKLLERNGFEVVEVLGGKECLERLETERPDIILMDVLLPDGDGKDFVRRIMENDATRGIPVIFMSSTVDLREDAGYEVFEINGEMFRAFAKPIHDRKIAAAIRKEINRKKHGGKLSDKSRINQRLDDESMPE